MGLCAFKQTTGHRHRVRARHLWALGVLMICASWVRGQVAEPPPLEMFGLGEATAAAFSPDGNQAAIGHNAMVSLFDLATGQRSRLLYGHRDSVNAVAYSADGTLLVSASADETVRIWDLETGQDLVIIQGPPGDAVDAAFAPGDAEFAVAYYVLEPNVPERNRIVRYTRGGIEIQTIQGIEAARILAMAYLPSGDQILASYSTGDAYLYDTGTGEVQAVYSDHADWIHSVAVTPDGTLAATASADGTVKLWDTATSQMVRIYTPSVWALSAAFSSNGDYLVTGGSEGQVRLFNLNSEIPLRSFEGLESNVSEVALSPDSAKVLATSESGGVLVWSRSTGAELARLSENSIAITCMAVSPDESKVVIGDNSGTATVWDTESGVLLHSLQGHSLRIADVAFSNDGSLIGTASLDGAARTWDSVGGTPVAPFTGHGQGVNCIAFSPTETNWVLTGGNDLNARRWNALTGEELLVYPQNSGAVMAVAFTPDGNEVLAADTEGFVKVWSTTQQDMLRVLLSAYNGPVNNVLVSPDGFRLVVSARDSNEIRSWNLLTLDPMPSFQATLPPITLGFSPNGALLAAGLVDGNTLVFNTETSAVVRAALGHYDWINDLAFLERGTRLLTASADRSLLYWPAHVSWEILQSILGRMVPLGAFDTNQDGQVTIGDVVESFKSLGSAPAAVDRE